MTGIDARGLRSNATRIALSAMLALGLWPALGMASNEASAAQDAHPSVKEHIAASLDGEHVEKESGLERFARFMTGASAGDGLSDTGHDIVLKYTMADSLAVADDETIDGVWSDPEKAGEKILGQYTSFADVYDPCDGGDYYVAFVDSTRLNEAGSTLDAQFTLANLDGVSVDDVAYDKDAGVAYIPKSHYFAEDGTELAYGLQAQILVAVDLSAQNSTSIDVDLESAADGVSTAAEHAIATIDPVEPTVTIPVVAEKDASKVALSDIELFVDDSESPVELDSDNAFYNAKTGELEFAMSGIALTSLKARVASASAANAPQPRVQDAGSLMSWPIGEFANLDTDKISEGQLIQYQGYVRQSANGYADVPEWTHIGAARDFAAKYGYTWSRNGYGVSGPGTTVGLMDAILHGGTWDSLTGPDMTTLEGSTPHMAIDVPFVFDGPSGDLAGTNWDGVSDEWGNQVYLHGGSDEVANAPTFAAYCAHASHSVDASGEWKYSTINMRVLKISEDYVVLGFVLPHFYTQSGVAVYKFKLASKGDLQLKKESSIPSITEGNECYSLEGAVFGVFNEAGEEVAELVTDASGATDAAVGLRAGWYTVKEKSASEGYLKAKDARVYVKAGELTTFSIDEPPANDPDRVRVQKLDKETGEASSLGKGTLGGAHYRFDYYDGYYYDVQEAQASGDPTRTWTMKTDENGVTMLEYGDDYKVSGDDFYKDKFGKTILPLGTLVVTEVKAPEGYLLQAAPHVVRVKLDAQTQRPYVEGDVSASDVNPAEGDMEALEQAKRGDFSFSKFDEASVRPLAGIPFKVTSKTTGESHVVVTDDNGRVDTASEFNKHTHNTNVNDDAADGDYDSEAGVWFSGAAEGGATPDDALGALPYDEYTVEEMPVAANEGLQLVAFDVTISRDSYKVDMGSVDDPTAGIATVARDAADGDKAVSVDDAAVVDDRVSYVNLIAGKDYKIVGMLYDKTAGSFVKSGDADLVVERTFAADSSSGFVDVRFEFDATGLAGHELVAFETIYDHDGRKIAEHADQNDSEQSVEIVPPEIATVAADGVDGDKNIVTVKNAEIIDTVSYSGLVPGKEYVVSGVLMDKGSGEAAFFDGKKIEASATFTPEKSSGSVDVRFEFDATGLAGHELVAFETLSKNGVEYANHADIDDADQAVVVRTPELVTLAADAADGDKNVVAGGAAGVVDVVSYENVDVGVEYVLESRLMKVVEGEDGSVAAEPVVDAEGEEVLGVLTDDRGEAVEGNILIADGLSGSVEVRFDFDATGLAGHELVVFEKLTRGGETVASHEDAASDAQSVVVVEPFIDTVATDAKDDDKTVSPDGGARVADEVRYENLVVGEAYSLHAILMDPDTGLPLLQGEKADSVDIEELTAFLEELAVAFGAGTWVEADDGTKVFESDVVVNAPEKGSAAEQEERGKAFTQRHCDLKAVRALMEEHPDFAELLAVGSAEFEPVSHKGSVQVEIEFDASRFADAVEPARAVVFEALTLDDTLTAVHADYADADQTVALSPAEIDTVATDATDGDHELVVSADARIVDRVSYEGLVPGEQHRMAGVLMDKESGEPLLVGDKPIEASVEFVPNSASGYVDVEFAVDASSLEGRSVVVFERASKVDPSTGDEIVVAVHEDIEDAAQTVNFTAGPAGTTEKPAATTESDEAQADLPAGSAYDKTGFARGFVGAVVAGLCMVGLVAGVYALRMRRNGESEEERAFEEEKSV